MHYTITPFGAGSYIKVNGRWAYLYPAVDSRGSTIDFYPSLRRSSKAAYRFLGKILTA
ncbi:hypothetical protein ETR_10647 [Erwinia tracheiphila PSU-1]|nr:hypothetical protein ETR_10647 [Erwinia tracheiphila PSU-1]